jgi:hypothetical protein
VTIRLAPPDDVPAAALVLAGQPQARVWHATEVLRSMVDAAPHPGGLVGAATPLPVTLGPCGYRVFLLTPASP